jgi:hypothetical protein
MLIRGLTIHVSKHNGGDVNRKDIVSGQIERLEADRRDWGNNSRVCKESHPCY